MTISVAPCDRCHQHVTAGRPRLAVDMIGTRRKFGEPCGNVLGVVFGVIGGLSTVNTLRWINTARRRHLPAGPGPGGERP